MSGVGELLVLGVEAVELLRDAEVDDFHLAVGRNHNVRRVEVAMDVPLVVQRHNARKDVFDNKDGKLELVVLILGVQLAGEGYLFAVAVGDFPF